MMLSRALFHSGGSVSEGSICVLQIGLRIDCVAALNVVSAGELVG